MALEVLGGGPTSPILCDNGDSDMSVRQPGFCKTPLKRGLGLQFYQLADSNRGLGCRAGESCRNTQKAKSPRKGREKLLRGQGQHDSGTKNAVQPGEQVEVWTGLLPAATEARAGQVVKPGTPGIRTFMLH